VRDIRNFYLEMCHLEYIIGRYKVRKLFNILNKSNKDNKELSFEEPNEENEIKCTF
jgi:hypothetical protein